MQGLLGEIFLIALLILFNGYLAGTEIAVVTAKKSHIKQMAERGKKNAAIFLRLKEEPDRFLATIQIGITVVGVLASAVGGATAIEVLKPAIQDVPVRFISTSAEPFDMRGILYAKDFLTTLSKTGQVDMRKILKPPFFVPETMKISLLLREMQKKGIHMALAVDEYGGISGLVTIEDLIEEIVGEIRDEYDVESPVVQSADGVMIIDASLSLRDLREDHHVVLPESSEYETLGGVLLTALQKIPHVGDVVVMDGKRISIVEMVGQRISKVKLEKLHETVGEKTSS
jgi:CBS domain containing-hemolysin-like protein